MARLPKKKSEETDEQARARLMKSLAQQDTETLAWLAGMLDYTMRDWADSFIRDLLDGLYDVHMVEILRKMLDRYRVEYSNKKPEAIHDLMVEMIRVRQEAAILVGAFNVQEEPDSGQRPGPYQIDSIERAVSIIEQYRGKPLPPRPTIREAEREEFRREQERAQAVKKVAPVKKALPKKAVPVVRKPAKPEPAEPAVIKTSSVAAASREKMRADKEAQAPVVPTAPTTTPNKKASK